MSNGETPASKPTLIGLLQQLVANKAVQETAKALAIIVISASLTYFGCRPAPLVIQQNGESFVFERTYGWVEDREAADAYATTLPFPVFGDTPAGRFDAPEQDAYLWKAVESAWAKYSGPAKTSQAYPNVNQNPVGCCVGAATKHCEDALSAVQTEVLKLPEEWKPVAVEAVYAFSRVEVNGGRCPIQPTRRDPHGDGSNGSWAAKAATTHGNLFMEEYPGADLSRFDPMRARDWGRRGVPDALEPTARRFVCKTASRVRSWEEFRRAVLQNYPVLLCSNVGFDNRDGTVGTRDADGFCRPNGVWPHAMAGIGVQGGSRPGGFILNSWGDRAHRGPVGKGNPPVAGFWADAKVIDEMCRSGDCWALSELNGFPARRIDWTVQAEPKRPSLRRLESPFTFALAP